MNREIEDLIDFWSLQESASREKRKTETFLDATGFCFGPDIERDKNGWPTHFSTNTDYSISAFITWRNELEYFRDLFDSFRLQIDEYLTEASVAAAEQFYLESISHHTGWGLDKTHWNITINRGSPWTSVQFELIKIKSVDFTVGFNEDGKAYIFYTEWLNFNDIHWRLADKNPDKCFRFSGKVFDPKLANHLTRRIIQHKRNVSDFGIKHPMFFKNYYSSQRSRDRYHSVKYNPWGTMVKKS